MNKTVAVASAVRKSQSATSTQHLSKLHQIYKISQSSCNNKQNDKQSGQQQKQTVSRSFDFGDATMSGMFNASRHPSTGKSHSAKRERTSHDSFSSVASQRIS